MVMNNATIPNASTAAAHRPHLREPNSWSLCDGSPCLGEAKGRRDAAKRLVIHAVIWLCAVSYSLAIATCFPNESPLLLLALLVLPSVADILAGELSCGA